MWERTPHFCSLFVRPGVNCYPCKRLKMQSVPLFPRFRTQFFCRVNRSVVPNHNCAPPLSNFVLPYVCQITCVIRQFWELVLTNLKLLWRRTITTLSGFGTDVFHLRDPTGHFGPTISAHRNQEVIRSNSLDHSSFFPELPPVPSILQNQT